MPEITPVGLPGPTSTTDPIVSGKYFLHFLDVALQPLSPPDTPWLIRVGRYQGVPMSHSISAS